MVLDPDPDIQEKAGADGPEKPDPDPTLEKPPDPQP